MKFVAILLSLVFSLNVMASSVSSLEKEMDEYQYTLTVEWDQKDQAFYNAKTDAFIATVAKLIREKGLSREEVLALAEKKMNNSKAFEALKLKMTLLGKNISSEELAQTLKDSAKDLYLNGASWNGEAVLISAFVGVFVIAIGYSIWFSLTHECVEKESVYRCDSYDVCESYSYEYDWETGHSYEYCNWWTTEQDCGYENVCTKWEKKK